MIEREKFGQGKTILLIMPDHFDIFDMLIKNIQYCGFRIIYTKRPDFFYKNFYERFYNFIRKNLLNDKNYKERKRNLIYCQNIIKIIDEDILLRNGELIDYALFIRADLYPQYLIRDIKKRCKKVINYQWDGLSRYPDIFQYMDFFDRFMIFDANDKKRYPQYQLHLTSNFYFDFLKSEMLDDYKKNKNNSIMYFLGSHIPERVSSIVSFLKITKSLSINYQFLILGIFNRQNEQRSYENLPVFFLDKPVSFKENLSKVQKSDILVDFINNIHSGLSFRVFESLCYKKKLITNNTEILKYDFYHPDNIFVFNENLHKMEDIKKFLDTPYKLLEKKIYQKYSFSNWLRYVLDIKPYQSLNFLNNE